jgi:regulator of protease activity HflC (stomatin/prohibitin superfamily)
MPSLTLGILLIVGGLIAFGLRAVSADPAKKATFTSAGVLALILAAALMIFASAVHVPFDRSGVVIRTLGADLPAGRIIATNGEKGPQAKLLGPGWHFGYWPWSYEIELADMLEIPTGNIGLVNALDGQALPSGTVYAAAWLDANAMIDAEKFLAEDAGGRGFRGPQLTILTPGTYRVHPLLFRVELREVTKIEAGEVGVVKANAGDIYSGADKLTVNGTDIVPNGHRGLWRQPLLPGAYNLHPDAYNVIKVRTSQRVYTYQRVDTRTDDSISVRSKDSFIFPVDVRLMLSVAADNAPYLVALLGNPDLVRNDQQENEELEILEARLILPMVRATLRNVAEALGALEFVANRSNVERTTYEQVTKALQPYRLDLQGVFIGSIGLDKTEAGQELIQTQTDKEVALNQKNTFAQQQQAEVARAELTRAKAEAEQQQQLVEAEYAVRTAGEQAKAQIERAKGEAEMIRLTSEARRASYEMLAAAIGKEGVTTLEALRLVNEGKIKITPDVFIQGGTGAGVNEALMGTLLRQSTVK